MIKALEIPEWTKKADKLKDSYKNEVDLKNDCDKKLGAEYYYILTDTLKNVVTITPRNIFEGGRSDRIHASRDLPAYFFIDGKLKRLNAKKIISELMPKLIKHIDIKELLEDTLMDQAPEDLLEIFTRLIKPKKKASIKQKPGCCYLAIGGKPGATFDLYLRT